MSTREYLAGLRTSLSSYPHLDAAVSRYRDDAALRKVTRLLGCGWSLGYLEGLLAHHCGPGRSADEVLSVVHLYAHIGPGDFAAWLAAYGDDIDALDDVETLCSVDVALAMRTTGLRLTSSHSLAG